MIRVDVRGVSRLPIAEMHAQNNRRLQEAMQESEQAFEEMEQESLRFDAL